MTLVHHLLAFWEEGNFGVERKMTKSTHGLMESWWIREGVSVWSVIMGRSMRHLRRANAAWRVSDASADGFRAIGLGTHSPEREGCETTKNDINDASMLAPQPAHQPFNTSVPNHDLGHKQKQDGGPSVSQNQNRQGSLLGLKRRENNDEDVRQDQGQWRRHSTFLSSITRHAGS